jgi:ATP-dependent helicase/nuclease subunit B
MGLDFKALDTLIDEQYAQHFQKTLAFLRILTHHWPSIIQGCGAEEKIIYHQNILKKAQ